MHLWGSTRVADGDSSQHGHGWRPSRSQHHGQQTHGQCDALWHVSIYGKPDGSRRHRRSSGRIGAYALHPYDDGTLVAGSAHRTARQHACPEQQLQADLHVGRRDLHQLTRPIHRDGSLTILFDYRHQNHLCNVLPIHHDLPLDRHCRDRFYIAVVSPFCLGFPVWPAMGGG